MSITTAPSRTSRQSKSHTSSRRFNSHRANNARDAVYAEFCPRDARAIAHDAFQDRRPTDFPLRLGVIAAEVSCTSGRAALVYWLGQAAVSTGDERTAALGIARALADLLGVSWAKIGSGEAA